VELRTVNLDELHQDPANARRHGERNVQAIVASLRQFGQVEPLVVQKSTGGNGRIDAIRKMGETEAQIVEVICKRYMAFTGDSPVRESDGAKFSDLLGAQP